MTEISHERTDSPSPLDQRAAVTLAKHEPLSNRCPFCAKPVSAATRRCPYCQETLVVALDATAEARGREAPRMRTGPHAPLARSKSVAVAVLLTVFFWPLGMLYSTVAGCLTMLSLHWVLVLLVGKKAVCLTFPLGLAWAAAAACNQNDRKASS
jgi:hypothetical protein